jgi:hypothetical protein
MGFLQQEKKHNTGRGKQKNIKHEAHINSMPKYLRDDTGYTSSKRPREHSEDTQRQCYSGTQYQTSKQCSYSLFRFFELLLQAVIHIRRSMSSSRSSLQNQSRKTLFITMCAVNELQLNQDIGKISVLRCPINRFYTHPHELGTIESHLAPRCAKSLQKTNVCCKNAEQAKL